MYRAVKIWVQCALKLYCRNIHVNDAGVLDQKGPLLLACNHPNSFLDAIIIGSRFRQPVHFLARGDAFRKPWARKLLSSLKLIPIYRLSEGRENLALNDATFEACREVLLNDGILLIFSEGLCLNDWKLRPLKKGTARIAIDAWQQMKITDDFRVLPVGINYNSFNRLGKEVMIHFEHPISADVFDWRKNNAELIQQFNQQLITGLRASVVESNANDEAVQLLLSNHIKTKIETLKTHLPNAEQIVSENNLLTPYYIRRRSFGSVIALIILLIPATAGTLVHAPLYFPLQMFVKRKTKDTVFYDSILFGALLITYPLYYILVNLIAWNATDNWLIRILCMLLPALAWIAIYYKALLNGSLNQMKIHRKQREILLQIH